MLRIVTDITKFRKLDTSIHTISHKIEDKINRFLRKLKDRGFIDDYTYTSLYVTGSTPGILYGLPKIHKAEVPLRPIFAAYKAAPYKLAKYLVPILSHLTKNKYTVENSYLFVKEVTGLKNVGACFMASMDVENLFTNVPLAETIDICIELLFKNCNIFMNLTKNLFKTFLELSVMNSVFVFDNQLYEQVDGLGMGLPLGPTFANIFMCYHEEKWLDACPQEFKPIFYRRYVDDTFVLFRDRDHAGKFLNYMNSQHNSIKFTLEVESNNHLPFLDIDVNRTHDALVTSVYRKPTFTGLGLSFFSSCSLRFKINAINTLLFRAYHICSAYSCMHLEFNFLKKFFVSNGYPLVFVEEKIHSFLESCYIQRETLVTVSKKPFYFVLPYFGEQSKKMKQDLIRKLNNFYPHIDFRVILRNDQTIGSFFRFKDRLPIAVRSFIVYEYCCALCNASYVGSTTRSLHCRISQHLGVSCRTNLALSRPDQSRIREHESGCRDCHISVDDFKILGNAGSGMDLRLLESMYIYSKKPTLNEYGAACQIHVFE